MSGAEAFYGVLLSLALLLNGMAVACTAPMGELLAPLRERSLLVGAVLLDLLVAPAALLVPAALLGVSDATFAGLVLLAAASTGPIGIALTRIGRGDVPVTVSIVTALGAANVISIPILMAVLLDGSVFVPVVEVGRSLLLLVLPLLAGVMTRRLLERGRRHPEAIARTARRLGAASTSLLGGALVTGFAIDPAGIVRTLVGAPAAIGLVMLVAAGVGALVLTRDGRRRRSLWLAATARAVGVALAVVAIHLPDADEARAVILAVGGLTQGLPVLLLLARDRWVRGRGRRGGGGRSAAAGGTEDGTARTGGPARA